ncbi:MAG: helix-turn-helix transcriptional regulator [Bacteroidaceae bacterium]|nr:helix-turn-helix transcriptional regulator [Bacteroidaceae bacterium]
MHNPGGEKGGAGLNKRIEGINLSDAETKLIGRCLAYAREEEGWSQEKTAEKLQKIGYDVSRATLSQYETGHHKYDIDGLMMFCDVFDKPMNVLIDFEGLMKIRKEERRKE